MKRCNPLSGGRTPTMVCRLEAPRSRSTSATRLRCLASRAPRPAVTKLLPAPPLPPPMGRIWLMPMLVGLYYRLWVRTDLKRSLLAQTRRWALGSARSEALALSSKYFSIPPGCNPPSRNIPSGKSRNAGNLAAALHHVRHQLRVILNQNPFFEIGSGRRQVTTPRVWLRQFQIL